jgi:Protein of unknown function (DUF3618)
MSSDPEQIRDEMEITRRSLSSDVNALADRVRPAPAARRQAGRLRRAAARFRDRVRAVAAAQRSSRARSRR